MHLRSFMAAVTMGAAFMALVSSPARADGFDARPVIIETRDGLGAIVITNPGDRRIYLETIVYDWSQDVAGHDVLAEADAAIASPPAMWVGPHSTYNLRVRLPVSEGGRERAYRVLIKQLPDRSDITAGRIVFALTQSLPAFAEPADLQPPALRGRLVDARHILISNDGGRRARIANIAQDGHIVAPGLNGYALSHSAVEILLPSPVHAGAIDLETDAGRKTLALR